MGLFKIQSAMEYLMTYGWAILIIAVVLGALFGLGFFNAANLAPKVTAGSCQVQRPEGPGTASYINLEGTCNNELPQYVGKFNGQSSNISTPSGPYVGYDPVTFGAWIYSEGSNSCQYGYIATGLNSAPPSIYGDLAGGSVEYVKCLPRSPATFLASIYGPDGSNAIIGSTANGYVLPQNSWIYFVYTYDGNTLNLYVDGAPVYYISEPTFQVGPQSGLSIGAEADQPGFSNYFLGSISNVQVYNVSLSANEILALYREGIGGAPISLQNLVGWWPLNGNANDYSGNLNNGVASNVVFTSSWTNGYSAP